MEIGIGTEKEQGIGTGGAIVAVFVVGFFFVCVFVDLVTCPQCGGTHIYEEFCLDCNGSGMVEGQVTCPECHGSGCYFVMGWPENCLECDGLGKLEGQVTCMKCFGNGRINKGCKICGPDGKITVLNYIYCRVSEGVENGGG